MQTKKNAREKKRLKGELLIRGMSLAQFAHRFGHNEYTVRDVIGRHWGEDSRPRGLKTLAVLHDLKCVMGQAAERMACDG